MSTTFQATLNDRINEFGHGVFHDLGQVEPSLFDMHYWNGRLMQWSASHPDFKVSLFQLVDVLPTLRSPEAICEHVRRYLQGPAGKIHPALA